MKPRSNVKALLIETIYDVFHTSEVDDIASLIRKVFEYASTLRHISKNDDRLIKVIEDSDEYIPFSSIFVKGPENFQGKREDITVAEAIANLPMELHRMITVLNHFTNDKDAVSFNRHIGKYKVNSVPSEQFIKYKAKEIADRFSDINIPLHVRDDVEACIKKMFQLLANREIDVHRLDKVLNHTATDVYVFMMSELELMSNATITYMSNAADIRQNVGIITLDAIKSTIYGHILDVMDGGTSPRFRELERIFVPTELQDDPKVWNKMKVTGIPSNSTIEALANQVFDELNLR